MITVNENRIIERPLDEVFAYVAEFSNVAEWDPGVVSSERITRGELGVGSRFAVTATFMGREVPLEYDMTAYEKNELAVFAVEADTFSAVDTIRFAALDGDRTEVRYTAEFRLQGLLRFVEPLLRPAFRRLGEKALDGLKSTLG